MTTQPEALRLAAALTRAVEQEAPDDDTIVVARWFVEDAAAELRRLQEVNTELLWFIKDFVNIIEKHGSIEGSEKTLTAIARAAINKAERTTT